MRANRRASLTESDLMSLLQLYPNGCGVDEAADFLQVGEETVGGWIEAGRQLRSGVQWKFARIVSGDNRFEWAGEEE